MAIFPSRSRRGSVVPLSKTENAISENVSDVTLRKNPIGKGFPNSKEDPSAQLVSRYSNFTASMAEHIFGKVETKTSVRSEEYFNYEPCWISKWIVEVAECSFASVDVYQSISRKHDFTRNTKIYPLNFSDGNFVGALNRACISPSKLAARMPNYVAQ